MALDLGFGTDSWESLNGRYGTAPLTPEHVPGSARHLVDSAPAAPLWSPQNPLFWLGAVMVATGLGLFSVGGSVKVVKTKASASIGDA